MSYQTVSVILFNDHESRIQFSPRTKNEIELRITCQNAITVKKRTDESAADLSIDYAKFHFVQGPYALLPRLLVMAAVPFSGCRGATILSFLQNFAPNINKHIPPLWKQRIPLLQGMNEFDKDFDINSQRIANQSWQCETY